MLQPDDVLKSPSGARLLARRKAIRTLANTNASLLHGRNDEWAVAARAVAAVMDAMAGTATAEARIAAHQPTLVSDSLAVVRERRRDAIAAEGQIKGEEIAAAQAQVYYRERAQAAAKDEVSEAMLALSESEALDKRVKEVLEAREQQAAAAKEAEAARAATQAMDVEARAAAAAERVRVAQRMAEELAVGKEQSQELEALLVMIQSGAKESEAEVKAAIAAAVAGGEVAIAALCCELAKVETARALASRAGADLSLVVEDVWAGQAAAERKAVEAAAARESAAEARDAYKALRAMRAEASEVAAASGSTLVALRAELEAVRTEPSEAASGSTREHGRELLVQQLAAAWEVQADAGSEARQATVALATGLKTQERPEARASEVEALAEERRVALEETRQCLVAAEAEATEAKVNATRDAENAALEAAAAAQEEAETEAAEAKVALAAALEATAAAEATAADVQAELLVSRGELSRVKAEAIEAAAALNAVQSEVAAAREVERVKAAVALRALEATQAEERTTVAQVLVQTSEADVASEVKVARVVADEAPPSPSPPPRPPLLSMDAVASAEAAIETGSAERLWLREAALQRLDNSLDRLDAMAEPGSPEWLHDAALDVGPASLTHGDIMNVLMHHACTTYAPRLHHACTTPRWGSSTNL